jgi:hypothetical protein
MSEEKRESFMQALDAWMDVNVIAPLVYSEDESDVETTEEQIAQVKKAMRAKMLDSYHNGRRAAGAKPAAQPVRAREYQQH